MTASVFYQAGRTNEAIDVLDNVIAIAEQPECGELAYHAELLRMRGEMLASLGGAQMEEATRTLSRALQLATERNQLHFAIRAALNLLTLAEGDDAALAEARQAARDLIGRFDADERSDEWHLAKAQLDRLEG